MDKLVYLMVFITILLAIASVILLYKNRILYKQLQNHNNEDFWRKLALTDDLTGIYNRTAYSEHINKIQNSHSSEFFGIVVFDVDDFKVINDNEGHLEGDEILKFVAQSIKSIFKPPMNSVYRIGGDEFAVISRGTSEKDIIGLLIKLRKLMGEKSDIRLSNGYSVIQGDVLTAFREADEMLYADKASRKERLYWKHSSYY